MKFRFRHNAIIAALALGTPALVQAQMHDWTSGGYLAQGLPNPLLAGHRVTATGPATKSFIGDITNQGDISWQTAATAWLSGSGTVLRNEGLFDLRADAGIASANNLGERFDNAGVLRKSAGTGVSVISAIFINRSGGVVDAASGAIAYRANTGFEQGSVFTGAGRHVFDDGYRTHYFYDEFRSDAAELRFAAGTFLSAGASPVTIDGHLTWSGGVLQGGWHNPQGRRLDAEAGGVKRVVGTLDNDGHVAWQTEQELNLYGAGTVFSNRGLFELAGDAGIVSGGNFGETFDNHGLLSKTAGMGTSAITARLVNRSGARLDAGAGTLAYRGNGSFEIGSLFTGSGVHRFDNGYATHTFHESVLNAAGVLQFAAGTFASGGSTSAVLEGGMQWSGGDLSGRWVFDGDGVVAAVPGTSKRLVGQLVNDGTLLWNTGNALVLYGSGTVLRNNGTFELRDNATITLGGNFGETFDNAGLLRKAGFEGQATITARLINRSAGVLDVASGSTLAYRGNSSFEAGSLFTGAGSHRFDNGYATYTFHHQAINASLDMHWAAGTFASGGSDPVALRGPLRWSGGQIQGQWHLESPSVVLAQTGGVKRLVGTLVNEGSVVWQATNSLELYGSGTVWRNEGSFDLQTNAGIVLGGNFGERFDNRGLLRKSGGDGTSTISSRLSNTGTIEVTSGTLALPAGFFNEGVLRGTASFAATLLDNRAVIAPGLPGDVARPIGDAPDERIATLTLQGNLALGDEGWLLFDLGDAGAVDLLAVSGSVSFDGSLQFSFLGMQPLEVGDTFRVLSFASYTGLLDDIVPVGFGSGVAFEPIYGATYLDLRVSAVPEPGVWWLMGAGLVVLWQRSGRSRRPLSGEVVAL